jgi:dihydroflavonol-4-reductase
VLFHTAAFFRDNYKGGRHWGDLYKVNVEGTEHLLAAAYDAGVRRMVHTSSVAVLNGPPGVPIDETMEREEAEADDYYRSKILSDRKVFAFLDSHTDMFVNVASGMDVRIWRRRADIVGPDSDGLHKQEAARNPARELLGRRRS